MGTGGNSGYQAANLAYLLGATKIYLLGFDNKPKGANNHWHPDHDRKSYHLSNPTAHLYKQWAHALSRLHELMAEQGVELINLSRETAHTIPRQTLEEVLNV